jgi:ectoine hydroxylase-related dioxygenase (phytanoyl-CoA dioxygenase family)
MRATQTAEIDPVLINRPSQRRILNAEQIEFYDEEGYLVLPGYLSDCDLDGARAAMEEKVEEMARDLLDAGMINDTLPEEPFKTRLAKLFDGLSDEHFLKYGRGWRDRRPGYFDLMSNSKILDAVEDLIGGEIFSNPVYNVRPKVPKVAAGAVPWHQDKSYWPDANSNPVITVWIPLVDANLENGCLHIWPRTHKTKVLSFHAETYSGTGFTEIDEEHLKEARVIPMPLAAGGAILFNDRCIHMSTPNNSDHVRWSVDLRYQPTDQDPMAGHGAGFLARSRKYPERVATLDDWLNNCPEHNPHP